MILILELIMTQLEVLMKIEKSIFIWFMNNKMWNLAFRDLSNKLEEYQLAQKSIEQMYTELSNMESPAAVYYKSERC